MQKGLENPIRKLYSQPTPLLRMGLGAQLKGALSDKKVHQ